jgi:hypothetical protein
MVSTLERTIWYSGLIGIYSFGFYKFFQAKSSFNQKYHDTYKQQAEKFVKTVNANNLKFLEINTKLLFLLGIDKDDISLKTFGIIEKLLEDFNLGFIQYERNIKK